MGNSKSSRSGEQHEAHLKQAKVLGKKEQCASILVSESIGQLQRGGFGR